MPRMIWNAENDAESISKTITQEAIMCGKPLTGNPLLGGLRRKPTLPRDIWIDQ